MRVEPFGLNVVLTYQSEAAVPAMFSCLFLSRLSNPGGGGKYPNLPVGENSVHIEQNKLDLLGPLLGHGADSSIQQKPFNLVADASSKVPGFLASGFPQGIRDSRILRSLRANNLRKYNF